MLIELAVVGAVGFAGFTLADKYNVFGNNASQTWWWERPPFAPAPATSTPAQIQAMQANARARAAQAVRVSPSPQQQIQTAQFEMAQAQRKIASATPQLLASSVPSSGLSKYVVTA